MKNKNTQFILQQAAEKCRQTGSKLTDKRAQILDILVQSESPLSAYDIVDIYNRSADKSMPAMSAYRILDFLQSEELVHKLSSENKFIACSHIACDHAHQVPQFLICRKCHKVKEIAIQRSIIEELKQSIKSTGYHLNNSQLEFDCLCEECTKAS